jgi:hypothetical protein
MNCAGCGTRRGADVEFFLDEDVSAVADEALLREASDGPDWLCETCGGSNRFSIQTCQTCGAPPGNSNFRKVVDGDLHAFRGADSDLRVTPDPSVTSPLAGEQTASDMRIVHPAWARASAGGGHVPGWTPALRTIGVVLAGVALLALLNLGGGRGGGSVSRFEQRVDPRHSISRSIELAVDRVEWKRSIVLEEYRKVIAEDWEDSVPPDAQVISRRQDIHHHDRMTVGSHTVQEHYTERVRSGSRTVTEHYTDREQAGTERYQCGTRNRGNGYFETVYCTRPVYRTVTKTRSKQVDDYQTVSRVRDKVVDDYKDIPAYRTKIKYSIKRWVPADTAIAQGTDLAPHWPKVGVSPARREGPRAESYRVFLRDVQNNKVYDREVGVDEFLLFTAGAKCTAKVNGFDQIVVFTPPAGGPSK